MSIDTFKSHSVEKARIALENELPTCYLDNQIFWLYLINQLGGTIYRDEVEDITAKLSAQDKPEYPLSLYDLCDSEPRIQRIQDAPNNFFNIPKDFFLKRFCFRYEHPVEEIDFSPITFSREAFNYRSKETTTAADVLSKGNNLIKDLYWLAGFGEIVTKRQTIIDHNTRKLVIYETYSLTQQGRDHNWMLDHLFKDALYEHLIDNDFRIITGGQSPFTKYNTEVISRP